MLLEREAGLARVREVLGAAGEGESSLMLLTGPLGIGRSAFLQQLPTLAAEEDIRVMRANAALMEQDFAFGVVRQLFDSLLASAPEEARRRWMAKADRHAHHVFSADGGAEAAHDVSAFEPILPSLRSLLAHVSDETPLLVLVDDLQWVDEPSLRWLAYLSKRLHGLRVLLVCSLRDGDPRAVNPLVREVTDSLAEEVRLAPLTPEATKVMIRDQFGEPGDEEYVRACHEVSAGNPLFLISVLLGMAVSGHRPTAEEAGIARSLRPSELRERLAGCLRTQPCAVRDLAAAIAVFGERGDTELITRLAGLDGAGFSSALRALRQLGLLADDQEPRFGHRVVEDAVESAMTVAEWERLHASAAALLYQSGRPAEQVAAQLLLVTSSGPDWAPVVLRSAADTALRRGAPQIAARYLLRALLYSPAQDEDRARLLIDLATAERAFDPAACERHIAQAVPLLTTTRDRASAVLRIPPTLLSRPSTASVGLLREVAEDLQAGGANDVAACEMSLRLEARLRHYGQESPAEVAAAAERLRGMGEEPPLETGGERELVTVLLGTATLSGRISAAEAAFSANRILEREPATSSVRARTVLSLLVITLCAADSVDAISSWLVTEPSTHTEVTADADSALLLAERALLLISRGRPARAHEYAERAVRLADPEWREASTVVLAAVALELRDAALTERILAKAGRAQSLSLALTTMLRMLHASLDAQSGERGRALESLLACGRQLEAAGWRNSALFPWRPRAIRLYQRLGDTRSALVLADAEHAWAADWGAPSMLGRALRLKGALHGEGGLPMLRQAVDVLRGSANELELARALTLLGRQLGRGPEAEEALREARRLASACGAPWLAERAENGPISAPQQQDASALTRSERKILALVRGGLTNQEIASELGVSSRAVEKHLTNSYRKLGVSGRREIVEFLSDPDALRSR
jgi:DNA-binding CsgD family transcriptional regulator